MMVSAKGRYALCVLIDLAQHAGEGCVSLSDVSRRQGVSLKYLESIASLLHKAGLIISQRGKTAVTRLPARRKRSACPRCCSSRRGACPPSCVWTAKTSVRKRRFA